MFEFLKFDNFKVLGSQSIGKLFFPVEYTSNRTYQSCLISVRHGRAVSVYDNDFSWINVKGIGWQFGGPDVLKSTKDNCLVFGLMETKDAKRELEVSLRLEKISNNYPKVLGYKKFSDVNLPDEFKDIVNVTYKNGELLYPAVLYTKMQSPFRMADLAFFTQDAKSEILQFYCGYFNCNKDNFVNAFCQRLGQNIGLLHKENIINDSLYYDNITLCAEICDYEWLTVPGMLLPNGDTGYQLQQERKEKEIIYAIEAVLRMASMLNLITDFYEILDNLLIGYECFNKDFSIHSKLLTNIRNRNKLIY